MAVIYTVTTTGTVNRGRLAVHAFMQGGWTKILDLPTEKKAKKFADLYAEATGLGTRVVDPT